VAAETMMSMNSENGEVAGVMLGLADEGRSNFEKSYLRTFIDMASDVVEERSPRRWTSQ
jgi:hypothetical protein